MATTGAQIFSNLKKQVNTAYTGQINASLFNYISERAVVSIVDEAIQGLPSQTAYDAISKLIKTEKEFTPYNSQVLLKPLMVASATVTVLNTEVQITFDRPHNLSASVIASDNYPALQISGVIGVMASGQDDGLNHAWYNDVVVVNEYTLGFNVSGFTTQALNTTVTGLGKMTSEAWVTDYYYLLTTNATYTETLNVSIKSILKTSKFTKINISLANNIANRELLNFTNFSGLSTIGDKYVLKQSQGTIVLYDDENLTIPTILTGTYVSGGTIKRIHSAYTKPYISDEKNTIYVPTVRYPRQESNDNRIKVYPLDSSKYTQTTYKIDYVSLPIAIDSTDTNYDYEQVYNKEFLKMYYVKAATIFLETLKDLEMFQILNAGK